MSVIGRRSPRYGDIRRIRNLASDYYAVTGDRKTVIKAELVSDVLLETSEWSVPAPSLDADLYLAGGDRYLYVLHEDGLTRIDENGVLPNVTDVFDVGGKWVVVGQDTVLAPEGRGVRVYSDLALGASKLVAPARMSQATEAVMDSVNSLLYVADQISAKIHVFRDLGTVLSYIDSFPARNCRDIVKLELDSVNDKLFVVCKHRIVSFSVPNDGVEDDAVSVALHEDYGVSRVTYTDFQVLPAGYWIGSDSDNAMYPNARFLGRVFAVFSPAESDNGVLVAAYPDVSQFAVSDVIPYVEDVADLPEIEEVTVPSEPPTLPPLPPTPPAPPPVILPDPPVITSALTSTGPEDIAWTYTITATGVGPITFSSPDLPAWASLNPLTGVITGTPPSPGAVNITIRATNVGGSDTEVLVLTVAPALPDMSGVSVNGVVETMHLDGSMLYVGGNMSTVTDASGTISRRGVARLNLLTGLWDQTWDAGINTVGAIVHAVATDGTHVYIGGNFLVVQSATRNRICRVLKSGNTLDATWDPDASGLVQAILLSGSTIYLGGSFTSMGANTRAKLAEVNNTTGSCTSWDPSTLAGWTNLRRIHDLGGSLLCSGAGGAGASGLLGETVCTVSKSTGVWGQASSGTAGGPGLRAAVNGSIVYAAGDFTSVRNLPDGTGISTRNSGAAFTLSGLSYTSWNPNFGTSGSTLHDYAFDDATSDVFAVGIFPSVGGDTAYKNVARITAGGSVVPSFALTFGAGAITVQAAVRYGQALMFGGNFSGVTINGVAKTHLAFVNKDTGALY